MFLKSKMAFKSDSASFGTYVGLDSIDGVQVRISENFLPPKKVTLPMKLENSFQCHNPSDVLFLGYDFSLEESVIKSCEAYWQAKQEHISDQATKQNSGVESLTEQSQSEESQPVANDEETNCKGSSCDVLPNGELQRGTSSKNCRPITGTESSQTTKPVIPGLSSDILIPVQLPALKPQESASDDQKTDSFNPADFEREREQDPFDNAELRVLNDLEELNKVLQNVQAVSSVTGAGNTADQATPGYDSGSTAAEPAAVTSGDCIVKQPGGTVDGNALTKCNSLSNTATAVSYSTQELAGRPAAYIQPSHPRTVKDITYPDLGPPKSSYSEQLAPQQNHVSGSGLSYGLPTAYSMPPTQNPSGMSFIHSTNCSSSGLTTASKGCASRSQGISAQFASELAKYPFSVLYHGAAVSLVQDGHLDGLRGTSSNRLRSASSTPDMSVLLDEMPKRVSTSQTPPPTLRSQNAYSDRDKWTKFGVISTESRDLHSSMPPALDSNNKPLLDSVKWALNDDGHKLHSLSQRSRCVPDASSSLPDPYSGMSNEAKSLVDTISAMGFPRARVARAVEKHGTDDKQVIDHLCLVARLSEKYPSDDVETALDLYKNDEKQAEKFLTLITQFCELGFSSDNVKGALSQSKLDENKTLDILTGNL